MKRAILNKFQLASAALLLVACLGILSCSKNSSDNFLPNKQLTFSVKTQYQVPLPSTIYFEPIFIEAKSIDSTEYINILCEDNHLIINNQQGTNLISMPIDGPKGVGEIVDFFFQNIDSIFLFSDSYARLTLIDTGGKISNSWEFPIPLMPDFGIESVIGYEDESDRIFFDSSSKSLTLRVTPLFDHNFDYRYFEYPLKIKYNLEEERIVKHFGEFPKVFSNRQVMFPNDATVHWVDTDGRYAIFTFKRDHYLYHWNLDENQLISKAPAKSNHLSIKFPLISRSATMSSLSKHLFTKGSYQSLYYDEYRARFYRFVKHEKKEGIRLKSFSIIVLNNALEVLGEFDIGKDYDPFQGVLILKSGIGLWKSMIEEQEEESIIFDIIDIQGI